MESSRLTSKPDRAGRRDGAGLLHGGDVRDAGARRRHQHWGLARPAPLALPNIEVLLFLAKTLCAPGRLVLVSTESVAKGPRQPRHNNGTYSLEGHSDQELEFQRVTGNKKYPLTIRMPLIVCFGFLYPKALRMHLLEYMQKREGVFESCSGTRTS